mmetsp:Transcript_25381/g.60377  ORF Transcript_25381/g.60377 Transcript_25381/m.60377 type:complete len:221 (+) Transcript_25381:1925-2587(+)
MSPSIPNGPSYSLSSPSSFSGSGSDSSLLPAVLPSSSSSSSSGFISYNNSWTIRSRILGLHPASLRAALAKLCAMTPSSIVVANARLMSLAARSASSILMDLRGLSEKWTSTSVPSPPASESAIAIILSFAMCTSNPILLAPVLELIADAMPFTRIRRKALLFSSRRERFIWSVNLSSPPNVKTSFSFFLLPKPRGLLSCFAPSSLRFGFSLLNIMGSGS